MSTVASLKSAMPSTPSVEFDRLVQNVKQQRRRALRAQVRRDARALAAARQFGPVGGGFEALHDRRTA